MKHDNTPIDPTPEMIEFYETRTKEHIARVTANMRLLAEVAEPSSEVVERADAHDASKFSQEERIPYIWLTEFHRRRRNGESFDYPAGVEQQIRAAIDHHVTSNRHHPEFHADANDMSEVDLIEMVCDWTAMAQEFCQDGGSAKGWADKTIGKRFQISAANTEFVYKMIAELDKRIAAAAKR